MTKFGSIDKEFGKSTPRLVYGDINFPSANWDIMHSDVREDQTILDFFSSSYYTQCIDFNTCGNNNLDVAFEQLLSIQTTPYSEFEKIFDISDHLPIKIEIDCKSYPHQKPVFETYSYTRADYLGIEQFVEENIFSPIRTTNVNVAIREWYEYIEVILEKFVPKRIIHRQTLPPWIKPGTSNLLRNLKHNGNFKEKPTPVRMSHLRECEESVATKSEEDRFEYQTKLFLSRDTHAIFKHFKIYRSTCSLHEPLRWNDKEEFSANGKVNLLNEYFQSVYNVTVPEIEGPLPGDSNILADLHFSKADIRNLLEKLDISESRGPNGLPPIVFQKLHSTMAASLCKLFKIFRKCSQFPICWKVGMISPKKEADLTLPTTDLLHFSILEKKYSRN